MKGRASIFAGKVPIGGPANLTLRPLSLALIFIVRLHDAGTLGLIQRCAALLASRSLEQ